MLRRFRRFGASRGLGASLRCREASSVASWPNRTPIRLGKRSSHIPSPSRMSMWSRPASSTTRTTPASRAGWNGVGRLAHGGHARAPRSFADHARQMTPTRRTQSGHFSTLADSHSISGSTMSLLTRTPHATCRSRCSPHGLAREQQASPADHPALRARCLATPPTRCLPLRPSKSCVPQVSRCSARPPGCALSTTPPPDCCTPSRRGCSRTASNSRSTVASHRRHGVIASPDGYVPTGMSVRSLVLGFTSIAEGSGRRGPGAR